MRKNTIHTIESLRARCVEDGDCLVWQGYFGNKTPMVFYSGKLMAVRRLMVQLVTGSARTNGYYVCKCGTHGCVEPSHITWRSQKQHMSHMAKTCAANESASAIRRAKIAAANRTISDEVVNEILTTSATGPQLAAKHGISKSTVAKYRSGKSAHTRAHNVWAGLIK